MTIELSDGIGPLSVVAGEQIISTSTPVTFKRECIQTEKPSCHQSNILLLDSLDTEIFDVEASQLF